MSETMNPYVQYYYETGHLMSLKEELHGEKVCVNCKMTAKDIRQSGRTKCWQGIGRVNCEAAVYGPFSTLKLLAARDAYALSLFVENDDPIEAAHVLLEYASGKMSIEEYAKELSEEN